MTYSNISLRLPDRTHSSIRRRKLIASFAAFVAAVAFAAVIAPRASALSDAEELGRFGSVGEGAGQLQLPRGIAADPVTGHVYAADSGSWRVSEFTPWGDFVKAFGWDVAPGAVNEQQEVRIKAANGQFSLGFGAESTGDLPFDASGAEVQAALEGLSTIGTGNVAVKTVPGTADGLSPYIYVVAFKGSLAGTDTSQLSAGDGTVPLSGGNPSTGIEVRTRADGAAGGTGLESCTEESGCKVGLAGSGAGQFEAAWSMDVDAGGNIYVRDITANRVQKFDSAGRFLLMFGGGVNQTTGADVCTREDVEVTHDVCGAGSEGNAPGEFFDGFDTALGADGTVFVGDKERIQEFEPSGVFKGQISGGALAGTTVRQLALNPQTGGFYSLLDSSSSEVYKLSSSGEEEAKCKIPVNPWGIGGLAADLAGNLYVSVMVNPFGPKWRVFGFDPSCNQIADLTGAEVSSMSGLTISAGTLYASNSTFAADGSISFWGPAPSMFEAPPLVSPTVVSQFASSVLRDGATVAAQINPHFWTNTRYYVQYGIGKCSEGGCTYEVPVPPGAILTSKTIQAPVRTTGVFLDDLEPSTTYHYRFVAQSGGGPTVGDEAAFTTYPELQPPGPCPNDALRLGSAARLPDCRAYEMVSPVDKNNGDIKALLDPTNYPTALDRSAEDGSRFTYSSYRGFAETQGAPYTIQYLAGRNPASGWSTEAISAPQGPAANQTVILENQYKAASDDLCSAWLVAITEPPLAPGAAANLPNLYRRDGCGENAYEALIQGEPNSEPGVKLIDFNPELQGASASGKEAILRIHLKLTTDATPGVWQTYYAEAGSLHLVCILPNGAPSGGDCSGGTGNEIGFTSANRYANVTNAISDDGRRVYWTSSKEASGPAKSSGPGKVYLRENPGAEQSAISGEECTEPEKACTLKVSETGSSKASRFLKANSDGSKALFQVTEGTKKDSLFEFTLGSGSSELAGKVIGLVAADDALSHVYFVSEEVLGAGARVGQPNLYLHHEEATTFIATLSNTDVVLAAKGSNGGIPSNTALEPLSRVARTSADGSTLAFISTERLGDYDNTDLITGEADSEVYLYEAGEAGPVCVSCNPSGARPVGRKIPGLVNTSNSLPTAASIPVGMTHHYLPRALSDDGRRLFFDSYDALLSRDTNGKQDVYEWERADGPEVCSQAGAELYVPSSSGCLSLISTGESPQDSQFLDASASGNDVFFTTNASLLPQDPGLIDIYDARVGGGFPQPVRVAQCEGEACQGPPSPPNDPTPASSAFEGAGNVKAEPKARCAKGKARRKGRCVAKKRHHKAGRANHNRRAGR